MSGDFFHDSVQAIAGALKERILWEMENGAVGYSNNVELTTNIVAAKETADSTILNVAEPALQEPTAQQVTGIVEDAAVALSALRDALGNCTRCGLHKQRTNIVFGEGNPNARLVFVGEGPGKDEDETGKPFVGAAGQLLTKIIEAMGLTRDEVYICNVVKCRPPNNRTPEETETSVCGLFVRRQLAVIRPKITVALGGTAAAYLLETKQPISKLRGRFHQHSGLMIMPTFHPSYLLRNPGEKRAVWNDMQMVMAELGLQKKK